MAYRICTNCNEKVPLHGSASCPRCNAPMTYKEEQRRREMRIENESRMANGKDPIHDVPETDMSVEPVEHGPGFVSRFVQFIKDRVLR